MDDSAADRHSMVVVLQPVASAAHPAREASRLDSSDLGLAEAGTEDSLVVARGVELPKFALQVEPMASVAPQPKYRVCHLHCSLNCWHSVGAERRLRIVRLHCAEVSLVDLQH